MTAYLLDTNVVSLLSPSRAGTAAGLMSWLDKANEATEFFLSVVTVHEIERGIMLLERKAPPARLAIFGAGWTACSRHTRTGSCR